MENNFLCLFQTACAHVCFLLSAWLNDRVPGLLSGAVAKGLSPW